ncbi:MAG: helix-turn-helix transcriptional regulator [Phycisphaera sp.]|nr:MAG: helix-turn-helix transcriptional regulator [Phycisphaera sp.]
MSPISHVVDQFLVRCLALNLPAGFRIDEHAHAWPQLVYASSGVLTVGTGSGIWVVPSRRAVCVPAGVEHSVACSGATAVRTLYFHPVMCGHWEDRPRVVGVSPLLTQLVLHVLELGGLRRDDARQRRLASVVLDQIATTREAPLRLPMPSDERAIRIADRIMANPGDARTLEGVAEGSGASARTLARLFAEQTGMSFGQWRTQARLAHALTRLAEGVPVQLVATEVGYEQPSAFIAMFKRELGETPGRYFDDAADGSARA